MLEKARIRDKRNQERLEIIKEMKFKLERTQNKWKQQTGPSENSEVKGGRRLVLRHEDSVGYSP